MARSIQQLEERIGTVIAPGFRGRLLARGLARNLIWSKGVLPEDAPPFSTNPTLTSDLLSYGLGLLGLALELRTLDKQNVRAMEAFSRAAEAIEAVVRDGDPQSAERGFFGVIAAAAYHLAHFSAKAFSLLPNRTDGFNLSPVEVALTQVITRNFVGLRRGLLNQFGGIGPDQTLSNNLDNINAELAREVEHERNDVADGDGGGDFATRQLDRFLRASLECIYFQALAAFDFALETGNSLGIEQALRFLDEGIKVSAEYGIVTMWWAFTLTRHMLDDLWAQSLHNRLPTSPTNDTSWDGLRWLFISKLFKQDRAEIELWPSQLLGATRAIDETDDLVITLPTSAGKTRIAELCILKALSMGQRVVFVTPLRALSAQTERSLRQTFAPLGFTVSALYGASGSVGDDSDSLRNREIVISTPEKLDFALRNDSTLLNNVGLIVLDEAHMLGLGEREVRYEVLVQRLLRREDAANRRIVCLSAILPQGEQLEDFVAWIRQDQQGQAIAESWRPTRQRFGKISWQGRSARLDFDVEDAEEDDLPYLNSFIVQRPPLGQQTKSLPRNRNDLTLMSAWRLIEDGQSVLIYCPIRSSVMALAKNALDLIRRGYLDSLFEGDRQVLAEATHIGQEWLGSDHPAVQCLAYGIAVHHAHLPRPFLRAIERLLKEQVLKVTISSPTLAQGLNLTATTVLFSGLMRNRKLIRGEEFANVAGRAGRAFVDVEGQVLCVAWERKHLMQWRKVLLEGRTRNIESGLLRLILFFCDGLAKKKGYSLDQVLAFITAEAGVWSPPRPVTLTTQDERDEQAAFEQAWAANLACLDSAILSMVQHDVDLENLAPAIDTALTSSLWQRSIAREDEVHSKIANLLLQKRAGFIWENSTPIQRKGYFFAGVSFDTGRFLDEHAQTLNALLNDADEGFSTNQIENALAALIRFAEIVFSTQPFTPDDGVPDNWAEIVHAWVHGRPMTDLAGHIDETTLEFIEDGLVYRLVWAMEAVRVRKSATENVLDATIAEITHEGRAALAIETGTTDYCASLLIQNGLASRIAANRASTDCNATFEDLRGLRRWLRSDAVTRRQDDPSWPTPETATLWRNFVRGASNSAAEKWEIQRFLVPVIWAAAIPAPTSPVRLSYDAQSGAISIYSINMEPLGSLPHRWDSEPAGTFVASVADDRNSLDIIYSGPVDFLVTR